MPKCYNCDTKIQILKFTKRQQGFQIENFQVFKKLDRPTMPPVTKSPPTPACFICNDFDRFWNCLRGGSGNAEIWPGDFRNLVPKAQDAPSLHGTNAPVLTAFFQVVLGLPWWGGWLQRRSLQSVPFFNQRQELSVIDWYARQQQHIDGIDASDPRCLKKSSGPD